MRLQNHFLTSCVYQIVLIRARAGSELHDRLLHHSVTTQSYHRQQLGRGREGFYHPGPCRRPLDGWQQRPFYEVWRRLERVVHMHLYVSTSTARDAKCVARARPSSCRLVDRGGGGVKVGSPQTPGSRPTRQAA